MTFSKRYLWIVIALGIFILVSEWAYWFWKQLNPGIMYSHIPGDERVWQDPGRSSTYFKTETNTPYPRSANVAR